MSRFTRKEIIGMIREVSNKELQQEIKFWIDAEGTDEIPALNNIIDLPDVYGKKWKEEILALEIKLGNVVRYNPMMHEGMEFKTTFKHDGEWYIRSRSFADLVNVI